MHSNHRFSKYFNASPIVFLAFLLFFLPNKLAVSQLPFAPDMLTSLLSAADVTHHPAGYKMNTFRPYLPLTGKVSFLTYPPINVDQALETLYYDAQNYLAPLILNPAPVETLAIIWTSNDSQMQKLASQNGYQITSVLSQGKALAVKIR